MLREVEVEVLIEVLREVEVEVLIEVEVEMLTEVEHKSVKTSLNKQYKPYNQTKNITLKHCALPKQQKIEEKQSSTLLEL